jgi:hypothetical protein
MVKIKSKVIKTYNKKTNPEKSENLTAQIIKIIEIKNPL